VVLVNDPRAAAAEGFQDAVVEWVLGK